MRRKLTQLQKKETKKISLPSLDKKRLSPRRIPLGIFYGSIGMGLLIAFFVFIALKNFSSTIPDLENRNESSNILFQNDSGQIVTGSFISSTSQAEQSIILISGFDQQDQNYSLLLSALAKQPFAVYRMNIQGAASSSVQEWVIFEQKIIEAISLMKRKFPGNPIIVIGASSAAHLLLRAVVRDQSSIDGLILLSPQMNILGMDRESDIQYYSGPLFVASSEEDEVASRSSAALFNLSPSTMKTLKKLSFAGHGIDLLSKDYLLNDLVNWISALPHQNRRITPRTIP